MHTKSRGNTSYLLIRLICEWCLRGLITKLDFCQYCQWVSEVVYLQRIVWVSCYRKSKHQDTQGYNRLAPHSPASCFRSVPPRCKKAQGLGMGAGVVWGGVGIKKHLHPSEYEECRCLYNESILVNNYLTFINCFLFPSTSYFCPCKPC